MASFMSSGWPQGATVNAYAQDAFGNQTGSSVASGTASAAGQVMFSGLADATGYVASDGSRSVRFRTSAASPGGSVVESVNTVAASGAAQTLPDVTAATLHRVTLTANCTLTFPAAGVGKSFALVLVQDATGGRTVTWPAGLLWPGGTVPTLTATANKRDVFTFVCVDGTSWLAFVSGQNL